MSTYTPKLIENPDMSEVIKQVKAHVEYMGTPEYHEDNDDHHYIFEAVVEACYGKEVWEWYREMQG